MSLVMVYVMVTGEQTQDAHREKNMEKYSKTADVWDNTGLESPPQGVCKEYVKVKH